MEERNNHEIKNHLYDGQTIIISGLNGMYYPRNLVREICEANVNDLTLICFNNNKVEDNTIENGDPLAIIKNGQVRKLITSDLGEISESYIDYVDEVEILPLEILKLKAQAAANRIQDNGGFYVSKEYASTYRDEEYINSHCFKLPNGKEVVLEAPFEADISIIATDKFNIESGNCNWNEGDYNCIDVAKTGNICFVEYYKENRDNNPYNCQLPGKYIYGYIKSSEDKFNK